MNLRDIQREAFATAKAKGHHAALHRYDERLHALYGASLVYAAVTEAVQILKREGVTPSSRDRLEEAIGRIYAETTEWAEVLLGRPAPVVARCASSTEQAAVRLVLTHTEIDEAIEALTQRTDDSDDGSRDIARELADIHIRAAEVAEHLDIDSDAAVRLILLANTLRPEGYGTPAEKKGAGN